MQSRNRTKLIEDKTVNTPILWEYITELIVKFVHFSFNPAIAAFSVFEGSIFGLRVELLIGIE
jgi:hypothetical protein